MTTYSSPSKLIGHKDRKSRNSHTNTPRASMGSSVGSNEERLDADTGMFTQLRGQSRQASVSQVKSHLKQEADTVVTKPENPSLFANERGFSILDNLRQLIQTVEAQTRELEDQKVRLDKLTKDSQNRIETLEGRARVSKNQIERLEGEARESKIKADTQDLSISNLEGQVANLGSISKGYLDIRMRFLDNYNKHVKKNPAFKHTAAIEIGNERAHSGHAQVDALLFRDDRDQKGRNDPETFQELYGIDYSTALELENADEGQIAAKIFRVLNAHATKVVSKHPPSKKLEDVFQRYVAKLNKEGVGSADAPENLVFWKIFNKEYSQELPPLE